MSGYRVGIDIGGTFTDLALRSALAGASASARSSPPPMTRCAVSARSWPRPASPPPAPAHVLHGTTLITNAVIERTGARTALLTTERGAGRMQ